MLAQLMAGVNSYGPIGCKAGFRAHVHVQSYGLGVTSILCYCTRGCDPVWTVLVKSFIVFGFYADGNFVEKNVCTLRSSRSPHGNETHIPIITSE